MRHFTELELRPDLWPWPLKVFSTSVVTTGSARAFFPPRWKKPVQNLFFQGGFFWFLPWFYPSLEKTGEHCQRSRDMNFFPVTFSSIFHIWTDGQKATPKSPPCMSTSGLKKNENTLVFMHFSHCTVPWPKSPFSIMNIHRATCTQIFQAARAHRHMAPILLPRLLM